MVKTKPVYLMHEEGLDIWEKVAVANGVLELLQIAGVDKIIEMEDFKAWRTNDHSNRDGSLKEFRSVDWYLEQGRRASRNNSQLDATAIIDALTIEPWRDYEDHYDIIITHSDIYMQGTNFLFGIAREGYGTLISTYRFKGLDSWLKYECIKTGAMHEVGHVFGLPKDGIKNTNNKLLEGHCINRCVMRQGLELPKDWINMTNDRLRYGALCNTCEKDLKAIFKNKK